ncbi:phospholipase [Pseudoduganella sp. DS3]|uniref:Phospholipase n=1 Tax=Pseudoduganella guangdongensis TaxID=2692179 RepID=A0A6N9HFC4_9BURK|nr:phospholipase D-like domain-containing protein [Pseudoduganella guangdongensis]MYN01753.1 phospholipase [Pseudoduganella guangdongensis]
MTEMNKHADLYTQSLSYRSNSPPAQCLAQPWFIRASYPVYYPRYGCSLEPLICGEEVFARIAEDLEKAQHSVDIITWGFDPGMVLVRGATAESGTRVGDLLKRIAERGKDSVKVRLLVWHDDFFAHEAMKNNPGYYGTRFPSIDCVFNDYYSESHQAYNAEWYKAVSSNKIRNIHLHVRRVPRSLLDLSLEGETAPSGVMANLSKLYATHHQKMVLIDYEMPEQAKGYVMGHNFITDFWDTKEHKFRDMRRERFYAKEHADVLNEAWSQGPQYDRFHNQPSEAQRRKKEQLVQSHIDAHSHVAKPYQDVSCRLQGPILYDLNHNFCQAWTESKPPSSTFKKLAWWVPPTLFPGTKETLIWVEDKLHQEMDPGFIERRKTIDLRALSLRDGRHNVQLLRTQPLHCEKLVKECYANFNRQAQNYIFIQNQYIQYRPWAEHLLECVHELRAAGYPHPIYVFILTSTPEKDGMDLPTYDVANRIGMSHTMPVEHADAIAEAKKQRARPPITADELSVNGINVFMGSLWTCAEKEGQLLPTDYEEIYIHAKVAIVDDAAFTIGSANLNLRSMALDSELNVLSEAQDVAYQLRVDLFSQCSGQPGPKRFGDMKSTIRKWKDLALDNSRLKAKGKHLESQLLPFHVNRKPGSPVI